jgi:tape measure domain-containing protein
MADDVSIRVRARGGRQAATEIGGVGKSLITLGRAGQIAGRGLHGATRSASGFGRTITSWRTAFVVGGLGSIGVAATRMGLEFNASMEQNQVAFTQFLGSSQAARAELSFLQKTAARTPFELPQITTAARRLMAFGFDAKQTNSWLSTIGDTIAGMGGGAQEIDQLVTAIGQIRSKGRLQGDELMQLSELGVVNRGKLAKDLGISTLELMSGKANVSGTKALRALQKQFDATFGGQSAKQARTFNGQLSTLHDNLAQTLGTITRPGFQVLERRVLPALGKTTDQINKTFGRKDLSFAEKFRISEADARRNLGPLVNAARGEIRKMHLGKRLADEFEKEAPVIADALGHIGVRAAGAFVHAWWGAGPLGKLFTTGLLFSKLGIFRLAGGIAARRFERRFIATTVADRAAYSALGTTIGGTIGAAAGVALVAYIGLKLQQKFGDRVGNLLSAPSQAAAAADADPSVQRGRRMMRDPHVQRSLRRFNRRHPGLVSGMGVGFDRREVDTLMRLGYPGLIPGAPGVPRDYVPGHPYQRGGHARRATAHSSVVVHSHLHMNGREVARAVNRVNTDADARQQRRPR